MGTCINTFWSLAESLGPHFPQGPIRLPFQTRCALIWTASSGTTSSPWTPNACPWPTQEGRGHCNYCAQTKPQLYTRSPVPSLQIKKSAGNARRAFIPSWAQKHREKEGGLTADSCATDWIDSELLCKLNKPDTGFIDHSIQYLQITSNTLQMFVWRLLCPSIIYIFCCDRINPSTERAAVINAQLLFYDTAGGASGVEPPLFVGFLSYAARLNEPKMMQLVTAAS